ncbi:recombination-associated protein RdgC [Photobacterium leiognathi]|uniref:recombination-associated protein RdgC n=1 Tax=Photobacterium leiognathi TaxID=553611 RepID=UPI002981D494|nr:recombination-associated protein RdgC [Photobacterium leiognathi]
MAVKFSSAFLTYLSDQAGDHLISEISESVPFTKASESTLKSWGFVPVIDTFICEKYDHCQIYSVMFEEKKIPNSNVMYLVEKEIKRRGNNDKPSKKEISDLKREIKNKLLRKALSTYSKAYLVYYPSKKSILTLNCSVKKIQPLFDLIKRHGISPHSLDTDNVVNLLKGIVQDNNVPTEITDLELDNQFNFFWPVDKSRANFKNIDPDSTLVSLAIEDGDVSKIKIYDDDLSCCINENLLLSSIKLSPPNTEMSDRDLLLFQVSKIFNVIEEFHKLAS